MLRGLSVIIVITSWVEKEAREGSSGITISESEEINIEVPKFVTKFVSEVKCGMLRVRNSSRTSGSAGVEGGAVGEEGSRPSFRTGKGHRMDLSKSHPNHSHTMLAQNRQLQHKRNISGSVDTDC